MEVGGVPSANVRRRCDCRSGLHREERLLEIGGDQPGDLAVATHCSPLADNERSNSNGSNDSTNASGSAASKSYSLEHRIRRASTSGWRHLAERRSCRELFEYRGSVFAAEECVDQKIVGSELPSAPVDVEPTDDHRSSVFYRPRRCDSPRNVFDRAKLQESDTGDQQEFYAFYRT